MSGQPVFLSWQNQTDEGRQRCLLRDAVKDAVKRAGNGFEYDEATRGSTGATDIWEDIERKIRSCAVFVPDLTFIGQAWNESSQTLLPNPNVIWEYSLARSIKDPNLCLPILNTHHGDVSRLPFDLSRRRVSIQFDLPDDADEDARAKAQNRIADELTGLLRRIVKSRALNLGLSEVARSIVEIYATESEHGIRGDPYHTPDELQSLTGRSASEIQEGLDELHVSQVLIDGPGQHLGASEQLFYLYDSLFFDWNPAEDAKALAQRLVGSDSDQLSARQVAGNTGWEARRINPALRFLVAHGLVREFGTVDSPYSPARIGETPETRRFVKDDIQLTSFRSRG